MIRIQVAMITSILSNRPNNLYIENNTSLHIVFVFFDKDGNLTTERVWCRINQLENQEGTHITAALSFQIEEIRAGRLSNTPSHLYLNRNRGHLYDVPLNPTYWRNDVATPSAPLEAELEEPNLQAALLASLSHPVCANNPVNVDPSYMPPIKERNNDRKNNQHGIKKTRENLKKQLEDRNKDWKKNYKTTSWGRSAFNAIIIGGSGVAIINYIPYLLIKKPYLVEKAIESTQKVVNNAKHYMMDPINWTYVRDKNFNNIVKSS